MYVLLQNNPTNQKLSGFTLVEVIIVVAIIGILAAIAYPRYQDYQDSMRAKIAVQDIKLMAPIIKQYALDNNELPDSLADIGMSNKLDPWGTPYVFYNIEKNGIGRARKDKNLVPLNSDYDLYSKGKDKLSRIPISQRDSKDDILRANDGRFVDLAANY